MRRNLITDRLEGFSKKPYGSLNVAYHVGDDPTLVEQNRVKLERTSGLKNIIFMDQQHGDRVVLIRDGKQDKEKPLKCDAIITDRASLGLAVMSADCAPILFYDPKNSAIGAAHAGWKGTCLQIAAKTAAAMKESFGTKYEDLKIGIAPCICAKCYEVGKEVVSEYMKLPREYQSALNNNHLDLRLANSLILQSIGVKKENIEIIDECTFENKNLFSHRRENITGRFASIVSLRPAFKMLKMTPNF